MTNYIYRYTIINVNERRALMKNLLFQIDEELHKKIKVRAAENGQTIKGYITTLIKKDLETKK